VPFAGRAPILVKGLFGRGGGGLVSGWLVLLGLAAGSEAPVPSGVTAEGTMPALHYPPPGHLSSLIFWRPEQLLHAPPSNLTLELAPAPRLTHPC